MNDIARFLLGVMLFGAMLAIWGLVTNRVGTAVASASSLVLDNQLEKTVVSTINQTSLCNNITYLSTDFTSNRYDAIPLGTLQISIWYDGDIVATDKLKLAIEYISPTSNQTNWLTIGDRADLNDSILSFGQQITTLEYNLGACELTGQVAVSGVVPNGVIDGLAFGLYAKYHDGTYHVLKSVSPASSEQANFVGAWPLGLNDSRFEQLTPHLTSGFGREQGKMMLYGAQYLQNGTYQLIPTNTFSGSPAIVKHQDKHLLPD